MNEVVYFFDSWSTVARIAVVGAIMYLAVVALLRLTGSRTLASLNVFDFIMTVAIGAASGRALTAKSVGLVSCCFRSPGGTSVRVQRAILSSDQSAGSVLLQGHVQERRDAAGAADTGRTARSSQERRNRITAIILESSGGFSIIRSIGDRSALSSKIRRQIDDLTRNGVI